MSLLGADLLRHPAPGAVKLYTTHEHWLICPMHVLWKYTQEPCREAACFRCVIAGKRPPQFWRSTQLLAQSASHVDRFLSPSRFTAAMHAERGFPEKVHHLPYFIDRADDDWRTPAPRPHDNPYFLFVGRLERIKGLHTLIDLWRRYHLPYDLVVAGAGSEEVALRAQASGLDRIRFLGPVPPARLGALYHHTLACLIPSITYETFGIVNIEAFARKTPVIARDLGALPEVVDESGGGLTYKTDEQLLQAIHRIAATPSLRQEMGERAYRAFQATWTREAHLRMYFNLIAELRSAKFGSNAASAPVSAA
jgi:glycosyltransferase involved in cell wall biosynthesis